MIGCCNTGTFIGCDEWNSVDYCTELEFNSKLWLDYNFLSIGGWEDVITGDTNCGQDLYTLSPVVDIAASVNLPNSYIYAVPKSGLVWENITHNSRTTIPVTIFHDSIDVTSDFDIDYDRGVFRSPINYSGVLTASYSYRSVRTYTNARSNWWTKLINNTFDLDKGEIWALFKTHGVQMPAIMIKCGPLVKTEPIQLGSLGKYIYRIVEFFVLSENSQTVNKISSILSKQIGNTIPFFDSDRADFPIACGGILMGNGQYPDIIASAPWKCVEIVGATTAEIQSPCAGLDMNRIRLTYKITNPVKIGV